MLSTIVPATPDMADRVSQLVHLSFSDLAADDWSPHARQVFLAESSPAAIADALQAPAFAAVETQGTTVTGFILLRKPSLLAMLFVHPGHLRMGIAKRLWEAARAHIEVASPEVKTVELNSTPYAVGAYLALGFVPISTEFEISGCRATRMACWLPGRVLGAEVLDGSR